MKAKGDASAPSHEEKSIWISMQKTMTNGRDWASRHQLAAH